MRHNYRKQLLMQIEPQSGSELTGCSQYKFHTVSNGLHFQTRQMLPADRFASGTTVYLDALIIRNAKIKYTI